VIIAIRIGRIVAGFVLTTWSDYLRLPTSDIASGALEQGGAYSNMHWLSPIATSYRIGTKATFIALS